MIAPSLLRWWYSLPPVARAPHWLGVVVALVAFVLLMAFHEVVSSNMQTNALRHQTTAAHDKATSRCKAIGVQPARDDCFSQVKVLISLSALPSS